MSSVSEKAYSLATLQVKIADFGVARVQTQSGVMTAETGTYRWMAPEVSNLDSFSFINSAYHGFRVTIPSKQGGEAGFSFFTTLKSLENVFVCPPSRFVKSVIPYFKK